MAHTPIPDARQCAEALPYAKPFEAPPGMYAAEEMDRTTQVDADAKNSKRLPKAYVRDQYIRSADARGLQVKIEKSDKYTDDQKVEFVWPPNSGLLN